MSKVQKISNWLVVISACSHFFCCVLPTISSIIGLGVSFGMITSNIEFFEWFHDKEESIILFSAGALIISAISQFISWRIDCHNSGCSHGKCTPKKKSSLNIFIIATILFLINLAVHIIYHTH